MIKFTRKKGIKMFRNFSEAGMEVITGEYTASIVILSIFIAVIASYSALAMNRRAKMDGFFHRYIWLLLASIAMGFGIWSMHFVGMSALSLPVHMEYDITLTILSIVPAMLSSLIAFYLANLPNRSVVIYLLAGLFMGTGISTMHYLGMYAMKMEIDYSYNKWIFVLSIAIAVAVSVVAVYIFSDLQKWMKNRYMHLLTAIIMGLAISSMHYTGMSSVTFYTPTIFQVSTEGHHTSNMGDLALIVVIGMVCLIGMLFLSSLIDRYVEYRTSYFDSFTKFPNHRLFEQNLLKLSSPASLAIWHLHDLEKLNKGYNYQFIDEVIKLLSDKLKAANLPNIQVYRIEGNRFAFISKEPLEEAINEVKNYIEPLFIDNQQIHLSSVWAVTEAKYDREVTGLYPNVLAVINHSSTKYENEVIFFNPAIHTYTFEREIINDIERAMEEEELFLVYQPKLYLHSHKISGIETLLRWNHPTYGMLSPAVFIPILEKNNRMFTVTDWIIEKVCIQLTEWREEGVTFEQVSINIPGEYVTSSKLLTVLKLRTTENNIVPSQLELEITETSFVKNIEEAIKAVIALRKEGFSIALDDFGTGVSSLSYLKKMPISTLKIDKSFIDEIPGSEKDSSIMQAIIALGQSLKLNIVFEGVETKEQVDFLKASCLVPIVQGYYFSKPQTKEDLVLWNNSFYDKVTFI